MYGYSLMFLFFLWGVFHLGLFSSLKIGLLLWLVVSEFMPPHCILCWCCLKMSRYKALKPFILQCTTYSFAARIGTLQWFFQLVRSNMMGHLLSPFQISFANWALKDKRLELLKLNNSLTLLFPFSASSIASWFIDDEHLAILMSHLHKSLKSL